MIALTDTPSPLRPTAQVLEKPSRFALLRRKLDEIATWTPEELREEFSAWTPDEIVELWEILEQPFRDMCSAFGLCSHRMKMGPRGIRTHGQIKRLEVLQEYAKMAQEKI